MGEAEGGLEGMVGMGSRMLVLAVSGKYSLSGGCWWRR